MRTREIQPYLYLSVGAFGLPAGSHWWVYGGTFLNLTVLFALFPETLVWYLPVWFLGAVTWLLGSIAFFNWARSKRKPRWLEHTIKWRWIDRDVFRGYRPEDAGPECLGGDDYES